MMQKSDLSIVLLSKSSKDVYPENSAAKFKNKLPLRLNIDLDDQWMVSLKYISLPKLRPAFSIDTSYEITDIASKNTLFPPEELLLRNISSNDALVARVNQSLYNKMYEKSPEISYDMDAKRFKITAGILPLLDEEKINVIPIFSNNFANSLGFNDLILDKKTDYIADTQPSIFSSKTAYILCDAVEPTIFGHKRLPLLQLLDIEADSNKKTTHHFVNPVSHKLIKTELESVEIHIIDEFGNSLSFVDECSYLMLQIKKYV